MMSTADRQSILNEIKVLAMLNHPNVIEYYENFLQDKAMVSGTLCCQQLCIFKVIAMEYAAGGTLYDLVDSKAKSGRHLEEEEVRGGYPDVLDSNGSSPGCSPFCPNSFGNAVCPPEPDPPPRPEIAKHISDSFTGPRENWRLWHFKDPLEQEQSFDSCRNTMLHLPRAVRGSSIQHEVSRQLFPNCSPRSDIWSLGCILYELCACKRAFEAPTLPALIMKIIRGALLFFFATICTTQTIFRSDFTFTSPVLSWFTAAAILLTCH